jgi:hypothetical protein
MTTCLKCGTEQAFGVAGHVEHTPERCLTVQLENVTAERDELQKDLNEHIKWEEDDGVLGACRLKNDALTRRVTELEEAIRECEGDGGCRASKALAASQAPRKEG